MADLLVKNQLDFLNSVVVEDPTTGLFSMDLTGTIAGERGKFKKITDLLNAITDVTRVGGVLKGDPRISGLTADVADGSITDAKLTESYVKTDGSKPLTGDWSAGGNKITGLPTPSASSEPATKGFVDVTKRTLVLPARGARGTATSGAGDASGLPESRELATNDINIDYMAFDSVSDETASWPLSMPDSWDGGAITFRVYWTAESGTPAETVIWGLQVRSFGDDDPLDAPQGVSVTVTDSLIATEDMHISAESADVTVAGSPAGGNYLIFELTRDTTDTLSADAQLLEIHIEYTSSSYGD